MFAGTFWGYSMVFFSVPGLVHVVHAFCSVSCVSINVFFLLENVSKALTVG